MPAREKRRACSGERESGAEQVQRDLLMGVFDRKCKSTLSLTIRWTFALIHKMWFGFFSHLYGFCSHFAKINGILFFTLHSEQKAFLLMF